MVTLRLIDHLCTKHADAAERRWPIPGSLRDLFNWCADCDDQQYRLHPRGDHSIRSLPALPLRDYDYVAALHEAAHTVLGVTAGLVPLSVMIVPRTIEVQDGAGGHVTWDSYSIPGDEWAAMVWAGQQAQRRWLAVERLDTRANFVDVANLGWDDTRLVMEFVAKHGVSQDIGWDLCTERLDQHWPSIERVADLLLARGRLTGDEIAEAAGLGCGVR